MKSDITDKLGEVLQGQQQLSSEISGVSSKIDEKSGNILSSISESSQTLSQKSDQLLSKLDNVSMTSYATIGLEIVLLIILVFIALIFKKK